MGKASVFVTTQLPNAQNDGLTSLINFTFCALMGFQDISFGLKEFQEYFPHKKKRISKLFLKILSLKFGIVMRYLLLLAPDRSGGCHALRAAGGTTWTSVVKGEKQKSRFDVLQKMY